jgi:hypothetical protein
MKFRMGKNWIKRMNYRYLDALTGIQDPGPSFKGLEQICERQQWKKKGHRALQPLGKEDSALFSAVEAWRSYYPFVCPKGSGQSHGFTTTCRSHGTPEVFFQDVPQNPTPACSWPFSQNPPHLGVRVTLKGHQLMGAARRIKVEGWPAFWKEAVS